MLISTSIKNMLIIVMIAILLVIAICRYHSDYGDFSVVCIGGFV